jgi:hypothetical protein
MKTIYDLIDSKAIALYWNNIYSNSIPYLGTALFPDRKKLGLKLEFLKGFRQLPIALMPSAFDTKPTLRGRIGVKDFSTKMPFFRESMKLNEEDRQQLLMFQEMANNQYAKQLMQNIYEDRANLVSGALVQSERMRMSLLVDGTIDIVAPDKSGVSVQYKYNYDPEGEWVDSNTDTVAKNWSDPTADIYGDIDKLKKDAQARGILLTRAICTTKTWSYICKNEAIKKDMNPVGYQNIIISDADVRRYLVEKLGITFTIYDKMYKNENGEDKQFYPDNYVTFLPTGTLGSTWYGTTPEEADLMGGNKDADVSIVNTGIAILNKKESLPVNLITSVSQIVLPSFERMGDVFVLKVVA